MHNLSGKCLRIGDRVRVKRIDPMLVSSLKGEERKLVESMVGRIFPVIEVSDDGFVVVESDSRQSESYTLVQSVCLSPLEYEILP